MNPDQLYIYFENKKNALITYIYKRIAQLLNETATQTVLQLANTKLVNGQLPKAANNTIDKLNSTLEKDITNLLKIGWNNSWHQATTKNDFLDEMISKVENIDVSYKTPYNVDMKWANASTKRAYDNFVQERTKTLQLSKSVWKLSNSHKSLIKEALIEVIENGTPAVKIAQQLREYVYRPKSSLDPRGQGQGAYKDPKKNAKRLARTEINRAFRKADANRWSQNESIAAVEIKRSRNHHKCDVCDGFIGVYPKDIVFTGFHPQCICYAIPILVPKEVQYQNLEYQLTGKNKPNLEQYYVKDIPDSAKKWYAEHKQQLEGWKNSFEFITDNNYFKGIKPKKQIKLRAYSKVG